MRYQNWGFSLLLFLIQCYNNHIGSCSCSRRWILRQSNGFQEHSRTREAPGRGGSNPSRPRRVRELSLRRLPRHSLRPNPQTILPILRHHRHHRFHLRRRLRGLPKLHHERTKATRQPTEYRYSSRKSRQTPNFRNRLAKLSDKSRRLARRRR